MLLIPWRVGLALQSDGWILRNDLIWAKRNGMPESVKDRCTRSHEYVLHLVKRGRYFWDAEAIREPSVSPEQDAHNQRYAKTYDAFDERVAETGKPGSMNSVGIHARPGPGGHNARTVWTFATQPLKDAHYAPFPDELPERAISAATSEWGCCPTCGAAWERVVDRAVSFGSGSGKAGNVPEGKWAGSEQAVSGTYDLRMGPLVTSTTTGWRQTCGCPRLEPIPCRVLDPFGGSGTTGVVANRLGRDATLIELKPEYATLSQVRLGREPLSLFAHHGQEALTGEAALQGPDTKQERHPNRTVLVFPPLVEAGDGAIGVTLEGAAG